MGHFKLSIKLTLGQKIIATMLILNVLVNMGFNNSLWAEENEGSVSISLSEFNRLSGGDATTRACEATEKDLNTRVREFSKACSASDSASCLQDLFNNDSGDSEAAGSSSTLSYTSSRDSLEGLKDELENLEKKKDQAQDRQNQAQEKVDELLNRQQTLKENIAALDMALQASFSNINDQTAVKLEELQTRIKTTEEQNFNLKQKLAAEKKEMIKFMAEARLTCSADAKKKAVNYYALARACSSGRGNCNISMKSLVRGGRRSLADWAKSYELSEKRKCLRVDSNNDFAVKYQAMQATMNVEQDLVDQQQKRILADRADLLNQIKLAQAQGTLAKNQAQLNKAYNVNRLSSQSLLLNTQIVLAQATTQMLEGEKTKILNEIDAKNSEIASARKKLSSSLTRSEISSLREAQILAPDLLHEASSAVQDTGCKCTGAFKSISRISGAHFCGEAPAVNTEEPVEENIVDEALQ